MTLNDQTKLVKRALLKRPLTAGEIAERAGQPSGRGISRALGALVNSGDAVVVSKRPTKFTKA